MEGLTSALMSIVFCTLYGFAVFGYFGLTAQMWAVGTLFVAFLFFLLGGGG